MVVGVDEVDLFPTVIVLVVVPVLDFVCVECVELSIAGNGRLASVLVWLSEVGLFAMDESVELEELDVNKVNDANDANEVDVQKSIVLSGLSLVVVVAETWTLRLSGNVPMYIVLAVLSVLVDIEVVELTVSCLAEVYGMPVVNSCNECIEVVEVVEAVDAVEVLVPVLVAVTELLALVDASLQLPVKKGSALDGMMLPM